METTYAVGPDDRLISAGGGWDAFASENGAPHLAASAVVGRPLWDFVSGAETRLLYRDLFRSLRRRGGEAAFPFRCDSAARRRFMRMEIRTRPEGVLEFRCVLEREEPAVLRGTAVDDGAPLKACSWCRRIETGGRWEDPAEAARARALFADPPAAITHGICPDCERRCIRGEE